MVYSILSFAQNSDQLDIQPDYSLCYEEVYKRVAAQIYPKHDKQILYDALSLQRTRVELPSFIPDWALPGVTSILELQEDAWNRMEDGMQSRYPKFRAGGDAETTISINPSQTAMSIEGVLVDRVYLRGDAWEKLGFETYSLQPSDLAKARSWFQSFQELTEAFKILHGLPGNPIYPTKQELCYANAVGINYALF